MGSEEFYDEERPVREVTVAPFWIDEHQVTVAEQTPDPAAYPDADPELLVPGSLVFYKTARPVDLPTFGVNSARHLDSDQAAYCLSVRRRRDTHGWSFVRDTEFDLDP